MYLFIQLSIARAGSGSGENFPDPTKKKMRIRNPASCPLLGVGGYIDSYLYIVLLPLVHWLGRNPDGWALPYFLDCYVGRYVLIYVDTFVFCRKIIIIQVIHFLIVNACMLVCPQLIKVRLFHDSNAFGCTGKFAFVSQLIPTVQS